MRISDWSSDVCSSDLNKGDGPPDLDEVWRDFNNRLGSLFGRKPKRGGSPFGGGDNGSGNGGGAAQFPKGSPKMVAVIIVILVGLWLASGFVIVQEGQVAVVTKFGKYTKTLQPGDRKSTRLNSSH